MCDCNVSKHPGIQCTEVGCTCHKESPTIWCVRGTLVIPMVAPEAYISELAEAVPSNNYFFATLTT